MLKKKGDGKMMVMMMRGRRGGLKFYMVLHDESMISRFQNRNLSLSLSMVSRLQV